MGGGKHLFAFFIASSAIKRSVDEGFFCIQDAALWRRIFGVLRLCDGEFVVFFDGSCSVLVKLVVRERNVVCGVIDKIEPSTPLKPSITLYQALPKKSCFEGVIHTAAVLGVTHIVPIITEKSARFLDQIDERGLSRMRVVMQTGCEQAKQYVLPVLKQSCLLSEIRLRVAAKSKKILFHQSGKPLVDLIDFLSSMSCDDEIGLVVGPEGDFTRQERIALLELGFESYQLTPSILRTEDAVMVGVGFLRSYFNRPTSAEQSIVF